MRLFSVLFDWFCQRLFWLCVLSAAGTTAQADVILWESTPLSGNVSFTQIAAGQIRSQAVDLTSPATVTTINLNSFMPSWFWYTGGPAQISLWLDSTPAERKTLVYTGEFRNSWTGLAVSLPKGRSFISLENLAGSQTIVWNQEIESGVPTRFHGSMAGVPVPEPSIGIAAGVAVCVMGAIGFFRRMKRNG